MNKKISTLLAAFLAAGFSYNAEAGVVKVTATPSANYKYVIAQDGFTLANTSKLALGASDEATFTNVHPNSITDAVKWTWGGNGNLTNVGSNTGIIQKGGTLSTTTVNNATFELETGGLLVVTNADGGRKAFKISGPGLGSNATDGDAYLYIETGAFVNAPVSAGCLTIDGKYLVRVGDNAVLVDELTYVLNGYTAEQGKWSVDATGVITNTPAGGTSMSVSKIEKISDSYKVTLAATGVALEKDKNNVGNTALYIGTEAVADLVQNQVVTSAAVPKAGPAETSGIAFTTGKTYMLHIDGGNNVTAEPNTVATSGTGDDETYYWTATAVEGQEDTYEFTNAKGAKLLVANEYQFIVKEVVGSPFFILKSTKADTYVTSTFTLAAFGATTSYFTFNAISTTNYEVGDLVKKLGDGFNLSIKSKEGDKGVSSFKFNPFQGKLTPVKATINTSGAVTGFEAYKSTDIVTSFMLQCADGIIVLDKSSKYPIEGISDFAGENGGFQFKVYSEDDMKDLLNATGNTAAAKLLAKTAYRFSISHPNSDLSGVELIKIKDGNDQVYRVISYGNDSEYYLSAGLQSLNIGTPVYATFDGNAMVKSTDEENNPLLLGYVNLVFSSHNVKVDGNALAMDNTAWGGIFASPVEISNVVLSKPEAQWAVTAKKDVPNYFKFTNRESGVYFEVANMYYMGGNKYAVAYENEDNGNRNQTFAYPNDASAKRDTLTIIGAEIEHGLLMDGYANFSALDVQDNQYRLAVASTSNTDFYITENHSGKHLLGLDKDVEEAATWRLVPLTNAKEYNSFGDIKTASDSIYIKNFVGYYNAKGEYKTYNDTLAIISYALQNASNGEYLTYQNPQTLKNLSMVCDENSTAYTTSKELNNAYRFILKEKQNGLYNLIGVKRSGETAASEFKMDPAHKLFGATTAASGAVEVKAMYKDINSNDLFDLQLVAAPEYRLKNMGDTIRIFRQENEYDQMFEKGEFLNIGNKAQLTTMAPALYVDTAYVNRGHNNRYQYLLVVNPKYVPAEPCTIEGHPAIHPDTTYGRFLVNLIDTAYVAYTKGAIHTNKYINEGEAGENLAKLGFVYGFRTGDKLYITDKNYKKSAKASDVIDLSTSDFNTAKFAFRYISPINHESDGSFKIQTGFYDYNSYVSNKKQPKVSNEGYLKNINGVVVVAKGYDKGDKFDLAAEHSNPTANEGVNATSFSVKAIDGAVVIAGAEGKTATINNVLGQTVVSTTITSSEATIAVPAGIVVVAVEGEAAVKAIVK